MWRVQLLRRVARGLDRRQEASDILLRRLSELESRTDNLSALIPQAQPAETAKKEVQQEKDYLNLDIQEYIALRSEQRTRLDSANKIIHYSAIVIAALIAGLLTLYKDAGKDQSLSAGLMTFGSSAGKDQFENILKNLLLLFPLISMPFALTQQNEEILVSRIGDYLDETRERIAKRLGSYEFWLWESWHNTDWSAPLYITAFFRATLLILFAVISLGFYLYQFKQPDSNLRWALFFLDSILLGLAIYVAFRMFLKRRKRGKSKRLHKRAEQLSSSKEIETGSSQLAG